jgi:hypothetical protein
MVFAPEFRGRLSCIYSDSESVWHKTFGYFFAYFARKIAGLSRCFLNQTVCLRVATYKCMRQFAKRRYWLTLLQTSIFIAITLACTTALAQLTPDQAKQDVRVLTAAPKALHPALTKYKTRAEMDASFTVFNSFGNAQSFISLPSDITYVSSGGYWKTATDEGTYRVIVQTGGFVHIVSRAQVDWVAHPNGQNDAPRVIASKIAETGSWKLDSPLFKKTQRKWRIEMQALETHHDPSVNGVWTIELGEPGVLKASVKTTSVRK